MSWYKCVKAGCRHPERIEAISGRTAPSCGNCGSKMAQEGIEIGADVSNYKPRNDNVLVRLVVVKERGGIAVPENSAEGKEFHVVAFGPKVEELTKGDVVVMTGVQKVDWDFMPGSKDLITIREANVLMVIRHEGE